MSTPEKCPKCGATLKGGFSDIYSCDSAFEEDDDGWFLAQSYHCVSTQRDQLAERVKLIEIERDELKVKVSFDELALQKMEERVKRLEAAGDAMAMAMAEGCRCDDWVICRRCADRVKAWHAAKGQP